jgi:Family of unknown function (DUF6279)
MYPEGVGPLASVARTRDRGSCPHMAIRFPIRLSAAFLISAAASGLSGCNKLKLGYEYADWFVIYSIEDDFDLDKPQTARLKLDVADYFHWHRTRVLPLYSDYLSDIAYHVRVGLRPADIDSGYARYQALRRMTLEPVAEKAADLLTALSPEQVDAWLDLQRRKNRKMRKEFGGTPGERLDHRFEKIIDEVEDWTGRLGKEQRNRIKAGNATLPWNGEQWLELREKVQAHLAELLKKKSSRAEVVDFLNLYYLDTDSLRSEEYLGKNREFESRLRQMIYVVHNVLTPEQKRHFIQQVEKLARDFRVLAKQE